MSKSDWRISKGQNSMETSVPNWTSQVLRTNRHPQESREIKVPRVAVMIEVFHLQSLKSCQLETSVSRSTFIRRKLQLFPKLMKMSMKRAKLLKVAKMLGPPWAWNHRAQQIRCHRRLSSIINKDEWNMSTKWVYQLREPKLTSCRNITVLRKFKRTSEGIVTDRQNCKRRKQRQRGKPIWISSTQWHLSSKRLSKATKLVRVSGRPWRRDGDWRWLWRI